MGTLNLSSLISNVQDFFGNRDDITDEDTIGYLNLAQEQIAKLEDWEELENTISGSFSVTATALDDKFLDLGTSLKEVHSFKVITNDGRSRKLDFISLRRFDSQIPEPEYFARGVPSVYTLHKGDAELWRIPDDTYSYIIRTTNWPTAFSSSDLGAKSDLDRKDLPLIYRTASIIADSLADTVTAKRYYNIYAQLIGIDQSEEDIKPDRKILPPSEVARSGGVRREGEYWTSPFITRVR